MSMQSHIERDGPHRSGKIIVAAIVTILVLAACDGANQGVQLGNGQAPDPVVVDFPIAYIRVPLQLDVDGDLVQTRRTGTG